MVYVAHPLKTSSIDPEQPSTWTLNQHTAVWRPECGCSQRQGHRLVICNVATLPIDVVDCPVRNRNNNITAARTPGSRSSCWRKGKRGPPEAVPHEGGMLPVSSLRDRIMISMTGMEPLPPHVCGSVPCSSFASRFISCTYGHAPADPHLRAA